MGWFRQINTKCKNTSAVNHANKRWKFVSDSVWTNVWMTKSSYSMFWITSQNKALPVLWVMVTSWLSRQIKLAGEYHKPAGVLVHNTHSLKKWVADKGEGKWESVTSVQHTETAVSLPDTGCKTNKEGDGVESFKRNSRVVRDKDRWS